MALLARSLRGFGAARFGAALLGAARVGARLSSGAHAGERGTFLHVGPSGDWWVGSSLYAAKHNPSDYVRSLPLPVGTVVAEDVPAAAIHAMYDAEAVDAAYLVPAWSCGSPTAALAPPGACVLGEDWTPCPLLERTWISEDTCVLAFGLPDGDRPLGLSTCACVLAKRPGGGEGEGDEAVVRPYTPVSTNAMVGQFELMVKVYAEGALSSFLARADVGTAVDFKHVAFNVKTQYPFGAKHVAMLCGGTGITPMLQALHALLGTADDATKVTVLYGSKTSADILAKATLDDWAAAHGDRLEVIHVLSDEPADSPSPFERGHITADLVRRHIPPPADEGKVFVCGPPAMYDALCGPRGEAGLGGALRDLGYAPEAVYKF